MADEDPPAIAEPDIVEQEDAVVIAPGLDEATNAVLDQLDLQSPDMTERGVRDRVMAQLGVAELSKSDKNHIKTALQMFIDRKSAEMDVMPSSDEDDEVSLSESGSEPDDGNYQQATKKTPKKRQKKLDLDKIPKKRQKKNAVADGRPKRPLSAYMYFSQDRRPQIRTENPDTAFGDLGRLLGQLWKSLEDSEKQPYNDKAQADKERFDKEMAEWKLTCPAKEAAAESIEAPTTSILPGKSKRKSRLSRGQPANPVEAVSDSDDEEPKEMGHVDRVLLAMKSSRRKRIIDISTEEMEVTAPELIERMRVASEADELAISQKKPATQKLKLLDEVEQEARKARMHELLLDSGLLRRFRDWLQPFPDGSLPNLTLRSRIYLLLDALPIDNDYLAESEGLGKVVMSLWKSPNETPKHRHLLRSLIEKWSRPMFHADTDYRHIHDHAEKRSHQIRSRLARLKSTPDRPVIRYQSHHAERPDRAVFDYSIRPQSRLLEDEANGDEEPHGLGPQEMSSRSRIKKNIDRIQREKKGKSRAVSVNLSRSR
uniref:HMG box domain-containing protein n=1 Tax=Spongospora subterranea TaxID=70186 RepID=A0A0H5R7U8_9EUKA|eukprot:CRZ09886.1 hypothetical protein [Spongospora subterranea]